MEELRLEGNTLFSTDPARAAVFYERAMNLYELAQQGGLAHTYSLEEYSKCAGNALTALFQVKNYAHCERLARRALETNPILAKANAFLGKVFLATDGTEGPSPLPGESAFLFLCRAVYQLPALLPTLRVALDSALDQLLNASNAPFDPESLQVTVAPGQFGNGVRAESALPPNTPLVALMNPFSIAVYEERWVAREICCGHCGTPPSHRTRSDATQCPNCYGLVWFCSAACQTAHGSEHALECPALQKLKVMTESIAARQVDVPENFFELAYHTITTVAAYRSCRPGKDVLLRLDSHTEEVAQHVHPTVDLLFELFSGREEKPFLAQVVGIIKCNALEVVDRESGQGVGQALYCANMVSFFNHSCRPNCCVDTSTGSILTTRAITSGEELFIAYIPQLYWPAALRRRELQEHYFFDCRCPRCEPPQVYLMEVEDETKKGSPRSVWASDPFERSLTMALPDRPAQSSVSSATAHYHPIVQAACYRIRAMDATSLQPRMISEMEKLLEEVSTHLFPFHYLCHEIRNTLSFLYAALGMEEPCFLSCMSELLLWETILTGSLPVKRLKLANALQCWDSLIHDSEAAGKSEIIQQRLTEQAVLAPYMTKLARLYQLIE